MILDILIQELNIEIKEEDIDKEEDTPLKGGVGGKEEEDFSCGVSLLFHLVFHAPL